MSRHDAGRRVARARAGLALAVVVGAAGTVAAGLGIVPTDGAPREAPPRTPARNPAARAPVAQDAAPADPSDAALALPPPPLPTGPALPASPDPGVGTRPDRAPVGSVAEPGPPLDAAVTTTAVFGRPSTLDRLHVVGVTHRYATDYAVLLTGLAPARGGAPRAEIWRLEDGALARSYLRLRVSPSERALGVADLGAGAPGILLQRDAGALRTFELRALHARDRAPVAATAAPSPDLVATGASRDRVAAAWRDGDGCALVIARRRPATGDELVAAERRADERVSAPRESVRATDAWAGEEGAAAACLVDELDGGQRVHLRWSTGRLAEGAAPRARAFAVTRARGVQVAVVAGRPLVVVEVADGLRLLDARSDVPLTLELPGGGPAVVGHDVLPCGGRAWIFVAVEDGGARAVTAIAFPVSSTGEPGPPLLVGARVGMVPSAAGRAVPRAAAGCDDTRRTAYAVWSTTDGFAAFAAWATR